jgi:hypothetical protein
MIHEHYSLEKSIPQMIRLYERTISEQKAAEPESTRSDSRSCQLAESQIAITVADMSSRDVTPNIHAEPDRQQLVARFKCAHPWPHEIGNSRPPVFRRAEGRFDYLDHLMLQDIVNGADLIFELRAKYGFTTRHIASMSDHVTVIAIGNWCAGAPDNYPDGWKTMSAEIFKDFSDVCWERRNQIVPLRMTTPEALKKLRDFGLVPNFIFINSSQFQPVESDLIRSDERLRDFSDGSGRRQRLDKFRRRYSRQEIHRKPCC